MKNKKQSKADADFISKIKTLSVVTKSSDAAGLSKIAKEHGIPEEITCPDCGDKAELIEATEVEVTVRRRRKKHDDSGEVMVTE